MNDLPTTPMCCRCYQETDDLLPANCNEKPEEHLNSALGMYHCPECGAMLLAGVPHGDLCRRCHSRTHPGIDVPLGMIKPKD